MLRRLDLEMDVNKFFENVSCQGHIQKIFQGGASIDLKTFLVPVLKLLEIYLSCLKLTG